MMADDPFARFERSRRGLLIPVAIFVFGAIATVGAMNLVVRIDQLEQQSAADVEAAKQLDLDVSQEIDFQPMDESEPASERPNLD